MDELIRESLSSFNVVSPISSIELILALVSAAVFNFILAKVYITTHDGYSYSKSFVHSIVLVGVIVALIMTIIGSNIARAFALVGAMSIVRFRNPVKDSRDLVFIFAAIAVGMASGTQFHLFSGIFTFFIVAILLGFHFWGFGELAHKGYVLKVRMKGSDKDTVSDLCRRLCNRFSIVSIDRVSQADDFEDVIYEIELKRNVSYEEFIDQLTQAVKSASINLLIGESNINV